MVIKGSVSGEGTILEQKTEAEVVEGAQLFHVLIALTHSSTYSGQILQSAPSLYVSPLQFPHLAPTCTSLRNAE